MLVIKLLGFAEILTFSTLDPVAHYATSSLIRRHVRTCMTSYSTKICHALNVLNCKNCKKVDFEKNQHITRMQNFPEAKLI